MKEEPADQDLFSATTPVVPIAVESFHRQPHTIFVLWMALKNAAKEAAKEAAKKAASVGLGGNQDPTASKGFVMIYRCRKVFFMTRKHFDKEYPRHGRITTRQKVWAAEPVLPPLPDGEWLNEYELSGNQLERDLYVSLQKAILDDETTGVSTSWGSQYDIELPPQKLEIQSG